MTAVQMSTLKMIVGLGNPGAKYALNRHNIGFQCIDRFARRHNISGGRVQSRAMTIDTWITNDLQRAKVLLVKPMTYMNDSGASVSPLSHYYNIEPSNIIVIHDDLDMEFGKIRLRRGGSSGGQNGIKSISQQLGTQDFGRVKVGIGRPPGRMDAAAYVLQDFSAQDEEVMAPLREKVCDALECWLFAGIEAAMNKFN
jgi:PTH1 family peptidyl-tRNA hydrolase